jgi:hypothetical protein
LSYAKGLIFTAPAAGLYAGALFALTPLKVLYKISWSYLDMLRTGRKVSRKAKL